MERQLISPFLPCIKTGNERWASDLARAVELKKIRGHLKKLSKHEALSMAHLLVHCFCACFCHLGWYEWARRYVFFSSSFSLYYCSAKFHHFLLLRVYVGSCRPQWDCSFLGHQAIKLGWRRSMSWQVDWDNLHPEPGHIYVSLSTRDLFMSYFFSNTHLIAWWKMITHCYVFLLCRRLSSFGLSGTLSGDIGSLSELQFLYVFPSPLLLGPLVFFLLKSTRGKKLLEHGYGVFLLKTKFVFHQTSIINLLSGLNINLIWISHGMQTYKILMSFCCRDLSYNTNLGGSLPSSIGTLSNLQNLWVLKLGGAQLVH